MISKTAKVLPLNARVDLFLVTLPLRISLLMRRTLGLLLLNFNRPLVLRGVHNPITDTTIGPLWNLVPLVLGAAVSLLNLHFLREQVEGVALLI